MAVAKAESKGGRRRDYYVLREQNLADVVADALGDGLTDEQWGALEKLTVHSKVATVNARHAEHAQTLGAKQIKVEDSEQVTVIVVPDRMWAERLFNLTPDTAVEPV